MLDTYVIAATLLGTITWVLKEGHLIHKVQEPRFIFLGHRKPGQRDTQGTRCISDSGSQVE